MGQNRAHMAERCALVTGANKGIGFEIVRQLASVGITTVLTARDETRGREATSRLHQMGLSNVMFHQLDVLDPASIEHLAKFMQENFGRLDILINNAAVNGLEVDEEGLRAMNIDAESWLSGKAAKLVQGVVRTTYEKAEECLNTNYYGIKRVTEALLPLLHQSQAKARIVNISSLRSELKRIPNEQIRNELGNVEKLSEEKIDNVLKKFLHDLKNDALEANGWCMTVPAYSISKASVNAYTRVLAKKYPNMLINCVHPGFVTTDLNWQMGTMSLEDGAKGPVKVALLPDEGPTGCYFDLTEVADF